MNKNNKFFYLFIFSLVVGGIFSLLASSFPDGLERVAEDRGFIFATKEFPYIAPLADYLFPGIENNYLATALAGITGTIITFFIILIFNRFIQSGKRKTYN